MYSQFSRLLLLVFSLVFVAFMIRLHLIVTVLVRQCWQATQVWFDTTAALSPFTSYLLLLIALAVWSLLESNFALRHARLKTNAAIAGGCCLASCLLLLGWLYFWAFLQQQSGQLSHNSFLMRWLSVAPADAQMFSPGYPSFYDFLYQHSCSQGRDFYEMSVAEIDALYIEYEAAAEQALQLQQ